MKMSQLSVLAKPLVWAAFALAAIYWCLLIIVVLPIIVVIDGFIRFVEWLDSLGR
jgi:hypothetical protein